MKALAPLIAGSVLLVVGIVGAVLTSMQPKAPKKEPPPTAAELVQQAIEARKQEKEEKRRLAAEQAKIDKNEIKQIILEQIRATPEDLSEGWFAEVFESIPSEDGFWEFLDESRASGARYDAMYTADYRKRNPRKAQPTAARYYLQEGNSFIYAAGKSEKRLHDTAPGLLDMALNREFLSHENGWEGARSDFLNSYLGSRIKLYE